MNLKLVFNLTLISLLTAALLASCSSGDTPQTEQEEPETHTMDMQAETTDAAPNTLTQEEIAEGWILLFDGETTQGWRGYNKDSIPENSKWVIEDGTLKFSGSADGEGGDILYDREFQNFHLSLEWKISEGGNSGIFYLGREIENTPIYFSAPEMQVLDNVNHPDANMGQNGNRKSGSLYDLIPAEPQNSNPHGEWNKAEVIVHNGNVVHFQNGEPVVEFYLGTPEWDEMVANSKFADWEHFGKASSGYIALQDHGDDVWFRNIKLLVRD